MSVPPRPRPEGPIATTAASRGCFACVVDEDRRFHLDALRWYASLTAVAGAAPDDLFVHAVAGTSSDVLAFVGSKGVTVHSVEPFDARSPHCNKISGALRMAEAGIEGLVVLCDTDVAVLEDPRSLELPRRAVAGKVVDAPVPPLEVLHTIFAASGLEVPPSVALPWGPGECTVSGNSNGGLYLVPGPLLATLAPAWAAWARWLLDRAELLGQWAVHVDQVSMALALASENVAPVQLDVRWNTPTHDPKRIPPDPPVPAVVHYHQEVDAEGLVLRTGKAPIDERIDVLNTAIRGVWTEATPQAGDADGFRRSRPERDEDEQLDAILATLVEAVAPATVLEVGTEDPDQLAGADVIVCRVPVPADLAQTEKLVRQLWRGAGRALVLRAHVDPEGDGSEAGAWGSLQATLRHAAPDGEIYLLDRPHPEATVVLLKPQPDRHPRDFVPATLDPLVLRHPDLLSLLVLRLHALTTTGFYPDHAPRLWEYPVVARLIVEHLPAGSRLADVGAGVTPLAPYLADRGYVVETVDPSETIRGWPAQPDWNEWGFLDYAAARLAHRSWNSTLHEVPRVPLFDGIYSISVIEHLPAAIRRALLADISARTRAGGLVALTIDLVPDSDDLWNLNLGVQVEVAAEHGTLRDVVRESADVGLELLDDDVVRKWGDSRVDVALLVFRRSTGRAARRWRAARRVASLARRPRP